MNLEELIFKKQGFELQYAGVVAWEETGIYVLVDEIDGKCGLFDSTRMQLEETTSAFINLISSSKEYDFKELGVRINFNDYYATTTTATTVYSATTASVYSTPKQQARQAYS